jgi:tripartite-type tricarboxylate transporter receptor subunit TctC
MLLLRPLSSAAFAVTALLLLGQANAEDAYPSRPITLLQGFGAGGNADVIARMIAAPLGDLLGKSVVVEAKPGAGGNLAAGQAARAAPDGHTLILLTGGHAVSAALYNSLPFDPLNDFQMISTVGYLAFVIGVKADSPFKSLADLISYARQNPGKLTYSSVGVGSTQHLAGELLCSLAGVQMVHVPYKGGGAPLNDLLGGRIDVLVDTLTVAGPQMAAGNVRALAVTSPTPWWSNPDIPPAATVVPGYDVRTWIGVAAPKGTPAPIVTTLQRDIANVLSEKEPVAALRKIGMDVKSSSPEQMRSLVSSEIEKWRAVVERAKIPKQ